MIEKQSGVEIGGFEPPQTEPKSVVLPLHHISNVTKSKNMWYKL